MNPLHEALAPFLLDELIDLVTEYVAELAIQETHKTTVFNEGVEDKQPEECGLATDNLVAQGRLYNGKKFGTWTYHNRNKELICRAEYWNGILEGPRLFVYFVDGVWSKCNYEAGKKHGWETFYSSRGVESQLFYWHGKNIPEPYPKTFDTYQLKCNRQTKDPYHNQVCLPCRGKILAEAVKKHNELVMKNNIKCAAMIMFHKKND